jgi:uncharacterized membrane protein YfcA
MDQRRPVAASLVAIVPAAVVGSVTYLLHGAVDPVAGAFIAVLLMITLSATSDVVAKGTSLLVSLVTGLVGTAANSRVRGAAAGHRRSAHGQGPPGAPVRRRRRRER